MAGASEIFARLTTSTNEPKTRATTKHILVKYPILLDLYFNQIRNFCSFVILGKTWGGGWGTVAAVPTKQKEISRSPCLPKSTKAKAAIDNRHQDQAKNDNRYSLPCCSHPNRNKNKLASTTRRNSLLHELQNKNRIETGLIHQSPPQVSSGQRIMSSLSYVSD